MKIIWRHKARIELANILEFITNRQSIVAAKKIIKQITDKAYDLSNLPEKYQKETLIETDRNIRRAIIHSYKIIFEITPDAIYILDDFHTSQDP